MKSLPLSYCLPTLQKSPLAHPLTSVQRTALLDTSFARWRTWVAAFGRRKLQRMAYARRPETATKARVQAQLATSSAVFQLKRQGVRQRVAHFFLNLLEFT